MTGNGNDEHDLLAARFEEARPRLKSVAWRMLGSDAEAEDAAGIENLGGWLTTVVARVALDMLRSKKSRHEEAFDEGVPEPALAEEEAIPFESEAILAESMGPALMAVLEALGPAERVAFVLHDLFDLPFDDVAKILGKSPAAARQLASRARRRVQGAPPDRDADRARKLEVVQAFLTASREGDFEALLAVLDPNVVVHADAVAVAAGAKPEIHGAETVATAFKGRARAAQPALLDGAVGAAWKMRGTVGGALAFTVVDGKVAAISVTMEPARLAAMRIEILPA